MEGGWGASPSRPHGWGMRGVGTSLGVPPSTGVAGGYRWVVMSAGGCWWLLVGAGGCVCKGYPSHPSHCPWDLVLGTGSSLGRLSV